MKCNTSHLFFPLPQAGVDQALEDAIAATEAEKEQVVSLNAELEALSEALADDSAGAEKLVRTIRLLLISRPWKCWCPENAFVHKALQFADGMQNVFKEDSMPACLAI